MKPDFKGHLYCPSKFIPGKTAKEKALCSCRPAVRFVFLMEILQIHLTLIAWDIVAALEDIIVLCTLGPKMPERMTIV
jgi:hypothetical protein